MRQETFSSDCSLFIKEYFANSNPLHRHNYFELIYVLEGRGIHVINENQFAYGRGDLFLLTPEDSHTFLAHELSKFCIIDFTPAFFGRNEPMDTAKPELSSFFKQLEYIFQNATRFEGYIRMSEEDRIFSATLIYRLISEWDKKVFFGEIVIQNLLFLLLNIIARYAATSVSETLKANPDNRAYEITAYLQHHIYKNELLTLENLAGHFNLSKDYISAYFKKHTGKSLKQFVLDYKLELVKTRLKHSGLTIAQIAMELNFTDESHLNKAFKKKYAMTAKQYRKKAYKINN